MRRYLFPLAVLLSMPPNGRAQDILERARARHARPDTSLHDYRARLDTRVSVGVIADPLAPARLAVASELATAVAWDRSAGVRVCVLGERYVTALRTGARAGLDFERPWFVATTPGDSLRLLGSGIEIPARAALHPFATGAERYYDYEMGDTLTLRLDARTVRLMEVRVTPTRGDAALVVGSLWVDAESGAIAAMQIRFVGKPLWADRRNPEGSSFANRILSVSAESEQGLWEGRYWLPRRQQVQLMVRVPLVGDLAIPIVFRTEFGRYRINTGEPIPWITPDSVRRSAPSDTGAAGMTLWIGTRDAKAESTRVVAGPSDGGFEIVRPPDDSLRAYDGWDRPLLEAGTPTLTLPPAEDLERRARRLGPAILGRRALAIQYDRLGDLLRYNRVEALGLGLSARWDLPGRPFWSVGGGLGFGVADLEPKGRLDVRYEAPRTRLGLAAYSDLDVAGAPLEGEGTATRGLFRTLLVGRDDADYYRASGGRLTGGRRWGRMRVRAAAAVEDEASVERHTQVALPRVWGDSVFRLNPPANEGRYARGDLSLTLFAGDWTRATGWAEVTFGAEAGTGPDGFDYLQPRADFRLRTRPAGLLNLTVQARAGWTAGDAPMQRLWRVGGLATARGYPYGVRAGGSFYAVRLELSRGGLIDPVLFGDAAWAGPTGDWGVRGDPVTSVGVGVGLLWGLLRLDLAFPESGGPWLETYIGTGR